MDRSNLDIDLLNRVNDLWRPVYPYLAAGIVEDYGRDTGSVLELGPFSGGIALELSRLCPRLHITIADESQTVLDRLRDQLTFAGISGGIRLQHSSLDRLSFPESHFDLVIVRGLIFFVEDVGNLWPEIFRVLKPGGLGVVGGGYGRKTPGQIIDELAEESRRLNENLGRKRVTVNGLEAQLEKAGLCDRARISTEGGLWIHLQKPSN